MPLARRIEDSEVLSSQIQQLDPTDFSLADIPSFHAQVFGNWDTCLTIEAIFRTRICSHSLAACDKPRERSSDRLPVVQALHHLWPIANELALAFRIP